METHASATVSPGPLPVTRNPDGSVTITMASTDIIVENTDDADDGIIAFSDAKRMLAREMCPASFTSRLGLTAWYCDLPPGHDGDHRAPGACEDAPDFTWAAQDTPPGDHPYPDLCIIQGERPYPPLPPACEAPSPKAGYLCTLTAGHDGQHEAHYWEDGRLLEAWPQEGPQEHQHQPVSYVAFDTPTLAGGPGGAA